MTDYEKLKVIELRALLKDRNIPSTGLTRKAQLIDKLREADAAPGSIAAEPQVTGHHAEQVSAVTELATDAAPPRHDTIQPVEDEARKTLTANAEAAASPEEPQIPTTTSADRKAEAEASVAPAERVEQPPIPSQDESQPSESPTETLSQITNDPVADENKKRKRDETSGSVDGTILPAEDGRVAKKAKTEEPLNKTSNGQETASFAAVEASLTDNAVDSEIKDAEPDGAHPVAKPNETPKGRQEERHVGETYKSVAAEVKMAAGPPKQGSSSRKDVRFESLFKTEPMTDSETLTASMMDKVPAPEKSVHPPTRALYIHGFMRPLSPSSLQNHMVAIGTRLGAETTAKIIELEQEAKTIDDERRAKAIEHELAAKKIELDRATKAVEFVYVDTIRSHAFIVFSSTPAAERARAFLHDTVWPKHSWRAAVWVDFIPEDKVHEWIATEKSVETDKSVVSRWEVVYDKTKDGRIEATLQQAQTQNRKESAPSARVSARSPPSTAEQAQPRQGPGQDKLFMTLDQKFRWTKTKPKLYWHTVPNDSVSKRSDNLKSYKRADWDPRKVRMSDEFGRYTFDDSALVYAGPHSLGPRAREREGLPPIRGGRRGGYRRR